MSIEENKKLVLRWIEEAWEKKNLDIVDELHAPDYVGHIVGTPGPIRAARHSKNYSPPTTPPSTFTARTSSSSRRVTRWLPTTPTALSTQVSSPESRQRARN